MTEPAQIAAEATASPLGNRQYRELWSAQAASNFGGQVQVVGASWLMASLTASPQLIALVQGAQSLGTVLVILFGGALADNYDRRRIMLIVQSAMLVTAAALAWLTWTGQVTPLFLLALTLLISALGSINNPAWQASIRDILQKRSKPERDAETVDLVLRHYDMVLVHGDPAFAALDASFAPADRIAHKIAYSGLVCPPPPPPSQHHFDVIVSAGGGAVGAGLVQAALDAARLMPDLARWCVIAGPNLPQADMDRLATDVPPNATLTRFRPDFTSLLAGARISVSQAGYNTVGDILQAGCRAVLVPFVAGGETEQADRAERLARIGRASVLPEDGLSGASMATAIRAGLAGPDPVTVPINVDGASRSADILHDLILRRRDQRSIT